MLVLGVCISVSVSARGRVRCRDKGWTFASDTSHMGLISGDAAPFRFCNSFALMAGFAFKAIKPRFFFGSTAGTAGTDAMRVNKLFVFLTWEVGEFLMFPYCKFDGIFEVRATAGDLIL